MEKSFLHVVSSIRGSAVQDAEWRAHGQRAKRGVCGCRAGPRWASSQHPAGARLLPPFSFSVISAVLRASAECWPLTDVSTKNIDHAPATYHLDMGTHHLSPKHSPRRIIPVLIACIAVVPASQTEPIERGFLIPSPCPWSPDPNGFGELSRQCPPSLPAFASPTQAFPVFLSHSSSNL